MERDIRILLVEDDAKLGNTTAEELRANQYETDLAYDGKVAQSMFNQHKYDLIILDINLPYLSGWELCKLFREQNRTVPIIMLTALGELQDKIDAFDKGADDYVMKPFHFSELLARIRVFLKRTVVNEGFDNVLRAGDLEINVAEKRVYRAGREINLTAKEFALLELLLRAKGRVLSKAEIADKIWNTRFDTGTNTIEVYVNFLRNKLDKPFDKPLIHTKAGFGYYLKERP